MPKEKEGRSYNGSTLVFDTNSGGSLPPLPAIFNKMKKCSKCNIEKPKTEFHKNGFDQLGNQRFRGYCKQCANKLESLRYQKKKDYINSKKTKCLKCGDDRFYLLDFHHKERENKDFTICQYKKGNLKLIQLEIDKCIVLCANCHREFHFLEKEQNINLETYLEIRKDDCNVLLYC